MKKSLVIFFTLFTLVDLLIARWVFQGIYSSGSSSPEIVSIEFQEGIGVGGIATDLSQADLIKSEFLFKAYVALSGQKNELQAGAYQVSRNSSIADVVNQLASGIEVPAEVTITIIEGWSSTDVLEYLPTSGLVASADDFINLFDSSYSGDTSSVIWEGFKNSNSLEGYIFPDTYEFYSDATPEFVVQTMVEHFESKITDEMKLKINRSDLTFYEILILASIVEKEVRTPEDRRVVAGIFLNRLENHQRIESDATINYITGKNTTRPNLDDLNVESLYNTYRNAGLPPTPISNPGLDSIKAVLNPTPSDYFFFLNTPDGTTIFTKTYDQHLEQKYKYY